MVPLPLLLLLVAAPAEDAGAGPIAGTWTVVDGSTVAYHLVHKLHSVEGVAHAVEGKARVTPDGGLQFAVRARVAAFDSGNSNRDAHMLEVTEAARFPSVTARGAAEGLRLGAVPATVELPLRATLDLHGVARQLAVTARVRFESPGRAEVEAIFPVSLTDHGVERPSLLFVKVEDRIEIVAKLVLVREPP
ncbi:MAG TPA: YceI family protein [Anaeromyxobacteraceae bacterium]|nr:YceI family protein [Anaeromyxobacteraceae bacterium]